MKNWLHFILLEDGRSQHEDETGNISSSPVPKSLVHTPDGWKDISVGYERDIKKLGLIKKFTFPLTFVRDGAKILRDAVYKAGYEFKLFYLIAQRTVEILTVPSKFKDYYTKWYRGEFDLSSFSDEENKIQCTIGAVGLEALIAARSETVYEIPLADMGASVFELDGMKLYSTITYNAPSEIEYSNTLFRNHHIIPFGIVVNDGSSSAVALFDQTLASVEGFATSQEFFNNSTNYFMALDTASLPVVVTLLGKFIVRVTKRDIPAAVRFRIRSNMGKNISIPGQSSSTVGVDKVIPINQTFTILPGEHVFIDGITFGLIGNSVGFKYVFIDESDVTVSFSDRYRTTYIKAFKAATLLDKLIEKICGKANQTITTLLTTTPFNKIYLTSGDGIRGINNSVLKISLNGFYDILRLLSFGSYSIEKDKLHFESIDKYFDTKAAVIDLGEVKSCKVTAPTQLMGNGIEIGHRNKDIEGLNGKLRFNNIHQYSTKAVRVAKKLSMVSPAMSDPYIIEYTRTNFDKKRTTDADKDNDPFVLIGEEKTVLNIQCIADRPKNTLLASGSKLSFENFNNVGFVANTAIDEFTWFGPPVTMILNGFLVPISTPTAGSNVTARLMVNGIMIIEQTIVADGVNSITLNNVRLINTGDFVSIVVIQNPVNSISIATCTLTINIDRMLVTALHRRTYDELLGVRDDTVFNIELITPKRLLKMWKKYFNSLFYKSAGGVYKFETTDRNPELYTRIGADIVDEDADEPITDDILFKPFLFEVETEVPVGLATILDVDQNRPFKFSWLGDEYKGFLMKAGISPDDNRSQVFSLLCSPDTDETKLVR